MGAAQHMPQVSHVVHSLNNASPFTVRYHQRFVCVAFPHCGTLISFCCGRPYLSSFAVLIKRPFVCNFYFVLDPFAADKNILIIIYVEDGRTPYLSLELKLIFIERANRQRGNYSYEFPLQSSVSTMFSSLCSLLLTVERNQSILLRLVSGIYFQSISVRLLSRR